MGRVRGNGGLREAGDEPGKGDASGNLDFKTALHSFGCDVPGLPGRLRLREAGLDAEGLITGKWPASANVGGVAIALCVRDVAGLDETEPKVNALELKPACIWSGLS